MSWPANTPTIHLSLDDLERLLIWGTIQCGDVLVSLDVGPGLDKYLAMMRRLEAAVEELKAGGL